MSRAVLLSTCGDVFITSLVLKLWKERWYDEVDHFYINFNNHCKVPDEVVGEFMKNWASEPKLTIIYHPEGIGNGPPQVELLKICNEDLIMLLEDDGFIFTSGVVDSWFNQLEDVVDLDNGGEEIKGYDIVGSPRYSAGEVGEAMREKYDLNYSGVGDKGYAWWPNFFVARRGNLLNTDLDFGSKHYPKGIYFEELDHTMEKDEYTDTGTWMNIQLRYMRLKDYSIPQNHAHPKDGENNKMYLWNNPDYIHGGSLSSGWGGYLQTPPSSATPDEKLEYETRCAFWKLSATQTEGYDEFKKQYLSGIDNLINSLNLSRDNVQKKFNTYMKIMKL